MTERLHSEMSPARRGQKFAAAVAQLPGRRFPLINDPQRPRLQLGDVVMTHHRASGRSLGLLAVEDRGHQGIVGIPLYYLEESGEPVTMYSSLDVHDLHPVVIGMPDQHGVLSLTDREGNKGYVLETSLKFIRPYFPAVRDQQEDLEATFDVEDAAYKTTLIMGALSVLMGIVYLVPETSELSDLSLQSGTCAIAMAAGIAWGLLANRKFEVSEAYKDSYVRSFTMDRLLQSVLRGIMDSALVVDKPTYLPFPPRR